MICIEIDACTLSGNFEPDTSSWIDMIAQVFHWVLAVVIESDLSMLSL